VRGGGGGPHIKAVHSIFMQ